MFSKNPCLHEDYMLSSPDNQFCNRLQVKSITDYNYPRPATTESVQLCTPSQTIATICNICNVHIIRNKYHMDAKNENHQSKHQ